jgi:hypothetical protein
MSPAARNLTDCSAASSATQYREARLGPHPVAGLTVHCRTPRDARTAAFRAYGKRVMRRGGAPGRRSVTAALIAVAAIAVPAALLTYAVVAASPSSVRESQIAGPSVLMPPAALNQGAPSSVGGPVERGGIPFGPPKLPAKLYGGLFTGTKLAVTPESLAGDLTKARSKSMRVFVILVGSQQHYKNSDGTFSLDLWKSLVDGFRGVDLTKFVEDGTIVAHQLVSEAKAPGQWGGKVIPNNVLDEMARYSKEIWPTMPTVLRTDPSDLEDDAAAFGAPWPGWKWTYLDAASARYLVRKGAVEEFAATEQASADRQHLALVAGLNVLSGGDGSSEIPSPASGNRAMSPDELLRYGSTMLRQTKACAFEMWRYETPGSAFEDYWYFRRPEITAAVVELAAIAARRPSRPCRR